MDQHLRRDTATVEARTTETVGLDNGNLPIGHGLVGKDVAAAGTNDHQVVAGTSRLRLFPQ